MPILTLAFVSLLSAQAAAPPTLRETLDWLRDRLLADGGFTIPPGGRTGSEIQSRFRGVEFETCTVRYTEIASAGGRPIASSRVSVALADIDPSSVKAQPTRLRMGEHSDVVFKTTGRQSITITSEFNGLTSAKSEWYVVFKDAAMASRFATALAHAAMLCAMQQPF